jgi:outer membrane protein OmpA-like peptidoglycan-associated protein
MFGDVRMFWMVRGNLARLTPAAIAVACCLSSPALAADCEALLNDFNRAIDAGQERQAQTFVDQVATSAECGRFQVPAQRRLAALRLSAAQLLMARGRPVDDYDRLLISAESPEVLWQASATMGEVRFGERRFVDAAQAYDRAIEIIKNESLTPNPPSKFEIDGLVERSGHSRLLAATGASSGGGEKFVKTARDQRDGTLGGFYSRSVRGIVPRALPVPITFEYRQTTFTGVGEQAASELITVLKEQRPSRIILIGHTDVRGTAEFNLKLSQGRAEAVAGFLRQNGINTQVMTAGKGANEPMRLVDSSGLSQDDIYALNRRVEWLRE